MKRHLKHRLMPEEKVSIFLKMFEEVIIINGGLYKACENTSFDTRRYYRMKNYNKLTVNSAEEILDIYNKRNKEKSTTSEDDA